MADNVQTMKTKIEAAWSGKVHNTPLRGDFETPPTVRPGGVTDALITIAAEVAAEEIRLAAQAIEQLAGEMGANDGRWSKPLSILAVSDALGIAAHRVRNRG